MRHVYLTMNESLTVRITRSAHAALRSLAEEADESMTEVLDKAIEAYRRASFLLASIETSPRCVRIELPGKKNSRNGEHGTPRSPMGSRINFR